MSLKQFFQGILLCLIPPLLLYGVFLGVAGLNNSRAAAGSVAQCTIDKKLAWASPNSNIIYTLGTNIQKPDAGAVLPPLPMDVVFVVDKSGSMTSYVEQLPTGVRVPSRRLVRGINPQTGKPFTRFALMFFANQALPASTDWIWTSERNALLYAAEESEQNPGGGNDNNALVDSIEKTVEPDDQKDTFVIIISDFKFGGQDDLKRRFSSIRSLKKTQLYALFVGGAGSGYETLAQDLVGSKDRVFQLNRPERMELELSRVFDVAGSQIPPHKASLDLDDRAFSMLSPDESRLVGDWQQAGQVGHYESQNYPLPPRIEVQAPLTAKKSGLWFVGKKPGGYVINTAAGVSEKLCAARPMLLVAPWWLLLLPFLPLLLWILHALAGLLKKRPKAPEVVTVTRPASGPSFRPLNLGGPDQKSIKTVPTFVLGLGEIGSRIARDLSYESYPDFAHPIKTLAIERPEENDDDLPSTGALGDVIRPPRDLAQLDRLVDSYANESKIAPAWLDVPSFTHMAKDQLDIAAGGRDNRSLNRLYGHEWLKEKGQISDIIDGIIDKLVPNGDKQLGQLIIALDGKDTFANSVLFDFARRARARAGTDPLDIIGLVLSDKHRRHEASEAAFRMEIETSHLLPRAMPAEVSKTAQSELSPFNDIFVLEGDPTGKSFTAEREARNVIHSLHNHLASSKILAWSERLGDDQALTRLWAVEARSLSEKALESAAVELKKRWVAHYVLGGVVAKSSGGWECSHLEVSAGEVLAAFLIEDDAKNKIGGGKLGRGLVAASKPQSSSLDALRAYFSDVNVFPDSVERDVLDLCAFIMSKVGTGTPALSLEDGLTFINEAKRHFDQIQKSGLPSEDHEECLVLAVSILDECEAQITELRDQALDLIHELEGKLSDMQHLGGIEAASEAAVLADAVESFVALAASSQDQGRLFVSVQPHMRKGKHLRLVGESQFEEQLSFLDMTAFFDHMSDMARRLLTAQSTGRFWRSEAAIDKNISGNLFVDGRGETLVIGPPPADAGESKTQLAFLSDIPPILSATEPGIFAEGYDSEGVIRVGTVRGDAFTQRENTKADDFVSQAERRASRVHNLLERAHNISIDRFEPVTRLLLSNQSAFEKFARLYASGEIKQVERLSGPIWMLGDVVLTLPNATLAEAGCAFSAKLSDDPSLIDGMTLRHAWPDDFANAKIISKDAKKWVTTPTPTDDDVFIHVLIENLMEGVI